MLGIESLLRALLTSRFEHNYMGWIPKDSLTEFDKQLRQVDEMYVSTKKLANFYKLKHFTDDQFASLCNIIINNSTEKQDKVNNPFNIVVKRRYDSVAIAFAKCFRTFVTVISVRKDRVRN